MEENDKTQRYCRKCLTRDMNQREYFKNLHQYIQNLDADKKTDTVTYEKRVAVCKECERLMDGMCNACGCYVELRASMKDRKCPYLYW